MLFKITAKRQVTFPAKVLEALGQSRAITWNWKRVRTVSSCALDESILGVSRRCAASSVVAGVPSTSSPSESSLMTQPFGIDTSILVRLLTGDPEDDFSH